MSLLETMLKKRLKSVDTDKFVIELNMPKKYGPIKAKKTEEGGVRERFMAAKAELPDEITVVRPFNVDCFTQSNEKSIYIAPNGCDSNCGCEDKPLATLEEALKRAVYSQLPQSVVGRLKATSRLFSIRICPEEASSGAVISS